MMPGEEGKTHIVLMTEGSRGDHQPYIALALHLQKTFAVTLVVNDGFQEFANQVGVNTVRNWGFNFQREAADLMQKIVGLSDPAEITTAFKPFFERIFPKRKTEVFDMAKGADIILASPVVMGFAAVCAKAMNIPILQLPLQPGLPTNEWPPVMLDPDNPPPLQDGQTMRDMHISLVKQFMGGFHEMFDQWRVEVGLESMGMDEAIEEMFAVPACCGYSDALAKHPSDYPSTAEAVGYWFLAQEEWVPPRELKEFAGAGDEAPLYIGFGSMGFPNPQELTAAVMEAVTKLNKRAILCEGWATLQPPESYDRDRFLFVKDVYHPTVLSMCSAAVIHGGAGTTAAVLRAGIPAIVCPFIADQPFWAARVKQAGVGLRGPNAKDIDKDNLAQAISEALGDDAIAAKARTVSEYIRAEPSFERVVERVNALLVAQ